MMDVEQHLTDQECADLEVARELAAAGVPLFLGTPDATKKLGFALPGRWQQTEPDPSVVDQWRPGMALCAVMGRTVDAIDADPRNGGDIHALDGILPTVYGVAATPSGGYHYLVAAMGCGSLDGAWPGIDVKSGMTDGNGRGFIFLAPTVKPSKVTGDPAAYRWLQAPSLAGVGEDRSGAGVAAQVRAQRSSGGKQQGVTGGSERYRAWANSTEPHPASAAERVITAELAAVADWKPDSGSDFRRVLLRAAYTLGGYVGCHYLDEDLARKRLDEAVSSAWGAPNDDDLKWIQQGLDDGGCRPFHVYTPEDEQRYSDEAVAAAAQGELPPAEGGPPETPWSFYAVLGAEAFDPALGGSDQGYAKAVAARMLPVLRYATDAKLWLVRDTRDVWHEYTDDMGEWAVAMLAELMPLGDPAPAATKKEDYTAEQRTAARRSLFMSSAGAGRISRKLHAILRAGHACSVRVTELDGNPEVLWAGGVPWDLGASGEVPTPAWWVDPGTPHLRTAWLAPDVGCPTPRWDAFLEAVWPDPEIRRWALRVLSIALTGYPDAALPMLYGPERSGKTSVAQMLVEVLGSYGHAASPKLLSAQDNTHPEIVYDLRGRRLSFIDEGPRRGHDATERLKQITGGGSLTGRAMRANSVTFAPSHTLIMTTNDEPHLTDPALRARMRLIPCEATESDVRPARLALLGGGLRAEAPGILAAMMRESAGYLADRDSASNASAPIVISDLVQGLAEGQDPVREWVENCTVPADPGTPGRVLYTAFCRWHQDSPVFRKTVIPTENFFGRSLSAMAYPAKKTRGKFYRPLSVLAGSAGIAPWEPMPDPHMTRTTEGGPVAADSRRFEGRIEPGTANEQNSRSTPISSSFLADLADLNQNIATNKNTPPKNAIEITEGCGTEPPAAKPPRSANPTGGKPPRSVPTSKTEARRRLKAEQREASICAAAGEVLALPAVVDRSGNLVPLTIEQATDIVRTTVDRSGALTVDVETTGYPVGHRDYSLRTVQLGDATAAVVLDPGAHAEVIRDLLAAAPKLHAHSATADLVPLAHASLIDADTAWAKTHDTVIPAKLADPASTGSDPGLKKLADAVLRDRAVAPAAEAGRDALFKAGRWLKKIEVDTPLERSGWAQVVPGCATMLRYAASDVLDTAALAQVLPLPPEAIYERERLVQRMTARVTHHGVRLDPVHIAALTERHTAGRTEAAARIQAFGIANPSSDQQVGLAAAQLGATLPRTKTGRPSVAAGVLEPLRDAEGPLGGLVTAVLDYRHHGTALSLFLEPYRLLCERGDGRARPTIYTLGTDTGRMASVRPNIQQLPREGGMRACLTADLGQLMVGADFSGVEIRVAAALSQDPTLCQFLIDGRDLHTEVAAMVYGYPPDQVPKAVRYRVKRGVFGWLYGGGVPTLATQMGVTQDVAQRMVDALNALVPALVAWSAHMRDAVRRGQTQFVSYSGRVIHLPREFPHKAGNYAVQGTARELLMDALIRWHATPWGHCVLIPVHDEVDVFVPAEQADAATAALVECMATELLGVRIEAAPAAPAFAWADSA